jgi:hypothetical protein
VDLTYDIRVLAPDLVGGDAEPLPPNRSQEKRWTKEIRTHLPLWINDQVVPLISRALSRQRLSARLSTEGEKGQNGSAWESQILNLTTATLCSLAGSLDDQIARISRMKASIFFVIRARWGPRFCSRQIPIKNVTIKPARESLSSRDPRPAARLSMSS